MQRQPSHDRPLTGDRPAAAVIIPPGEGLTEGPIGHGGDHRAAGRVAPGRRDASAPAALGRLAQAGDAGALACLVERHQAALTRFCRRLVGEGAPDLAQETLLRALQAPGRLQEPARFPAWLLGIAANLARKGWQRRARWPLSLEGLAETYPDVP